MLKHTKLIVMLTIGLLFLLSACSEEVQNYKTYTAKLCCGELLPSHPNYSNNNKESNTLPDSEIGHSMVLNTYYNKHFKTNFAHIQHFTLGRVLDYYYVIENGKLRQCWNPSIYIIEEDGKMRKNPMRELNELLDYPIGSTTFELIIIDENSADLIETRTDVRLIYHFFRDSK